MNEISKIIESGEILKNDTLKKKEVCENKLNRNIMLYLKGLINK
jgi:hypothetical protein